MAFVLYNLVFGFVMTGIDVAAHVGGLVGGFLCGLILSQPLTPAALPGRVGRNLLVVLCGGGLVVVGSLVLPGNLADVNKNLKEIAAIEEKAIKTNNTAYQRLQQHAISDEEYARIVEQDILPEWRRARSQLPPIDKLPREGQRRLTLFADYLLAREESWELQVQAIRENDHAKAARAKVRWSAAENLAKEIEREAKK